MEQAEEMILAIAMRKAVYEYRKAFTWEVEGMSDHEIWDHIREKPFTIGAFTRFQANETKVLARIMIRLDDLEEQVRGLLKNKSSD